MAGASIDHMVSLTILIAALLVAMMSFNQIFSTAVAYETNTQVATKAVDIMNTICLSPGNPVGWGQTNEPLSGFGLQDPEDGGYSLSPNSLMRLRTSNSSGETQLIEYPGTPGVLYNNMSANFGHGVFLPVGDCVTYADATELLGINGTYGFRLDITPTLNVKINQTDTHPLVLTVEVSGSGLPLVDANLKCHLFAVDAGGSYPVLELYSKIEQTNSSGIAELAFTEVMDNNPAYSFTVYVDIGGISGVGYFTHNTLADENVQYIIPLIQDFDDGTVLIAHNWEVDPPAITYNATFFVLTSDFQLQPFIISNSTGLLNFGEGKPYYVTEIPESEVGLLVISYRKSTNDVGTVILPWGFSSLGVAASFGGDFGSDGSDFVATELRQVTVDGISYQVKVSAWKLGN